MKLKSILIHQRYFMIFRTKAQYMATQYLSSALQKIEDNLYEEVELLFIVTMF